MKNVKLTKKQLIILEKLLTNKVFTKTLECKNKDLTTILRYYPARILINKVRSFQKYINTNSASIRYINHFSNEKKHNEVKKDLFKYGIDTIINSNIDLIIY